jgi:hypothetical protein
MSRVILIAWDGADWRILDPLLEQVPCPISKPSSTGPARGPPLHRPHALLVGLALVPHRRRPRSPRRLRHPRDEARHPQAVPGHLPLDQGADVPRRPHGRRQEPALARRPAHVPGAGDQGEPPRRRGPAEGPHVHPPGRPARVAQSGSSRRPRVRRSGCGVDMDKTDFWAVVFTAAVAAALGYGVARDAIELGHAALVIAALLLMFALSGSMTSSDQPALTHEVVPEPEGAPFPVGFQAPS